jgi:GNAT superfamily N-acetyltransferase
LAGIGVRRASAQDLAFFRNLYGSFRAAELAAAPWTTDQRRAFLDDQFRLQHLHFTRVFARADFLVVTKAVALAGPRDVGRLYLDRSERHWRIVDIGLTPEMRGTGIGTALFVGIKSAARADGAQGVALRVAQANPRARELYLRQGFADDGAPEGYHQPMLWRT